MPNTKSAKKSAVQSKKRRQLNVSHRSMIRTFIKKTKTAIKTKEKKIAENRFIFVQSILDRYATKGLIHKNKAARHKSKLSALIKKM